MTKEKEIGEMKGKRKDKKVEQKRNYTSCVSSYYRCLANISRNNNNNAIWR